MSSQTANKQQTIIYVKPRSWLHAYKDGGTQRLKGWDGKDYYEDHRIGTITEGAIFDRYPGDHGAQVLPVRLVEVNKNIKD